MVKLMRVLLLVVAVALVAGGCSGTDQPPAVATPKGFDLPAGVSLTEGGTTLAYGKPASVVYQVADKTRSAITVTVTAVDRGSMADFKFFSLDDTAKQSTPIYVRATVKNFGPAGLGGAPVPLYVHDSTNTIAQPNELVGDFRPCPVRVLPASFLPGASANVCLVYLLPKGAALESIDLRTSDLKVPITWKP